MKKNISIFFLFLLFTSLDLFFPTRVEALRSLTEVKDMHEMKKMNYLEKKMYIRKERKKHKEKCYEDPRVVAANSEFAAKAAYKKCVLEFRFDQPDYIRKLEK
tara:strand:+ start:880 stop:1188 length:309 start_codon:yes stop_codon:yes gene_type:complete